MTNKERFIELLRSTKREGIEKLIDFLEKTDFFTAPASTRFHMSCEGRTAAAFAQCLRLPG